MESYVKKYNEYITNHTEADHRNILDELQTNLLSNHFLTLGLIDDINLLDLPELAACVENVFDKFF